MAKKMNAPRQIAQVKPINIPKWINGFGKFLR